MVRQAVVGVYQARFSSLFLVGRTYNAQGRRMKRHIVKKTLYGKGGAIISYHEGGEVIERLLLDAEGKVVEYWSLTCHSYYSANQRQ